MIPCEITLRIDATCRPTVAPGDAVFRGQKVCEEPGEQTCPIAGTIQTVRFDPDNHEFMIVVVPVHQTD